MALQQPHVRCIRRVVIQRLSFLQRKMVHLQGVGLHRDYMTAEARRHVPGYGRLTAAGRPSQSNDEDAFVSRHRGLSIQSFASHAKASLRVSKMGNSRREKLPTLSANA